MTMQLNVAAAIDLIEMLASIEGPPSNFLPGDAVFAHISGVYNVSRAKAIIDKNPARYGPHPLQVTQEMRDELIKLMAIDAQHLHDLDEEELAEPAIAVMLPMVDDFTPLLIIDGNHRLIARVDRGLRILDTYVLPSSDLAQIMVYRTKLDVAAVMRARDKNADFVIKRPGQKL